MRSERGEKTYRPWEPERSRQDAQSPAAKLKYFVMMYDKAVP
jgi:hypothetical protein